MADLEQPVNPNMFLDCGKQANYPREPTHTQGHHPSQPVDSKQSLNLPFALNLLDKQQYTEL